MNKNDVTIILATSVLPSHPDTKIIDETIKSVRFHFPKNEIIMQIDGLRREQMDREIDYNEYKNRILWKCLHEYENILPIIFDKHSHQSTMMRKTIDDIQTSALLYVEGDAPLTTDVDIDWQKCFDLIGNEKANTIRFHHESFIPKPHNQNWRPGMDNKNITTAAAKPATRANHCAMTPCGAKV